MSISNEVAERDKLLDLASETITKLNKRVDEIGEKIHNNDNSSNNQSLKQLYDNYCKRGDCKDIDHVNNLLKYLEDSLKATKNEEVKSKIRNAIQQVKSTLDIKY